MTTSSDWLYDYLRVFREQDETGHFRILVNALADPMQPVWDVVRDTDNLPPWAVALDVDLAPASVLGWQGQFVGVSVENQPEGEARSTIRDTPAMRRGRPDTIVEIAKRYLHGDKLVSLYERDTSPYHYTVEVYEAELGGQTYDELAAAYPTYPDLDAAFTTYSKMRGSLDDLTEAMLRAKPGGLMMTLNILPGMDYDTLDAEIGTYDDLTATGLTYDELVHTMPGGL